MAKLSNEELLESFKEMTLLELSEFVKLFEETFDVKAAAPAAVVDDRHLHRLLGGPVDPPDRHPYLGRLRGVPPYVGEGFEHDAEDRPLHLARQQLGEPLLQIEYDLRRGRLAKPGDEPGQLAEIVSAQRPGIPAAGVGVLSSLLPYMFDQIVLRRVGRGRFAVLLALLPATATVIGLVALGQMPGPLEAVGIAAVVVAVALRSREGDESDGSGPGGITGGEPLEGRS